MTPAPVLVAFVPDLMDRSKVAAVAPTATFVATAAELVEQGAAADIVVVDLSRPGAIDAIAQLLAPRTIGFGSHVDEATLSAARAAGCDVVVPRSTFFATMAELLQPG